MKRKLKKQLKTAFYAPEPKRKAEFLATLNFPKTSRCEFIMTQVGYIRKRVWVTSCVIVAVALAGLQLYNEEDIMSPVWLISSFLPFISLVTMTELTRSSFYNMTELEMGCKYRYTDIVLARLGIISCFNTFVFVLIISLLGEKFNNIFLLGIYLLIPFMLTCLLSLFTLNLFRSRETLYICGGISCFVSISNMSFAKQYERIFSDMYWQPWSIAFIVLLLLAVRETIKLLRKTEELQWNLSLID